jgi:multiple sugar transport system permease protein
MKADIAVLPRSRGLGYRLRKTVRDPQARFCAIVLLPLLASFCIFTLWSIIRGVELAFTTYHLLNPSLDKFVGLNNFRSVFADPLFWHSLENSALWGVLGNFIGIPLALAISVCLVSIKRGRNLYQTLIFVPVVLSIVSVIVLVNYLLDPVTGPVDHILALLHLPTSTFLQSGTTALPTMVGFAIGKGMGVTIVILTAGLLNIPGELIDAASVDGASGWTRFWRITLPLLQPTLNLIIVLGIIGSLQEYTTPKVMTNGGPDNATYMLNMYIFDTGFGNLEFGMAAAASLVEFAITLFLTLVVLRALQLKWSY